MAPFVYRCPRNYFPFWHIGARLGVAPVNRFLRRMQQEGKRHFLDIGTGAGANCLLAARRNFAVYACDQSRNALVELRRVAHFVRLDGAIACSVSDACHLPFPPQTLDVVLASHIIEHLDDPAGLVKECERLLRPGGVLRLSCPSLYHGGRISRWMGLALDPADHRVLGYARDEIEGMLPASFSVERVTYQGRLLESNLADAQTGLARLAGLRAVSQPKDGIAERPQPSMFAYLAKEAVLLPALLCCKLEDALLPFVKGSMITMEIRKKSG